MRATRRWVWIATWLLVCGCGGGDGADLEPAPGPDVTTAKAWPTEGWPTALSEEHGLDSAVLEELDAELSAGDWGNVDAFLLIRDGFLIHDSRFDVDYVALSAGYDQAPHQYNYYHPDWHPFYRGSDLHTLQSVTKSWASTLIGIAIGRGEIEGIDVRALSFFPDREFPDPDGRKARMTLEDLLTMRAGFEWNENEVPYTDPTNDCAILEASEDWIQVVLGKPLAADPGTKWVYNSGVSVLLSGILEAATGQPLDRYAEEHLFGPLGITDYHWKKTPLGLADTEGGLYLEPRDLAKLGLLYLEDGVWEGRRILPEGWAEAATRGWVEDTDPDNDRRDAAYGYQWWVLPPERVGGHAAFAALGYGGQYLIVIPGLDLIAVFNGWDIYDESPRTIELFLERVLPMLGVAKSVEEGS